MNKDVFLCIGSNDGDRRRNLKAAVAAIGKLDGTKITGVSSLYLTEPVGMDWSKWVLNCVVGIETPLGPIELLTAVEGIEISLGRTGKGASGPRTADIDILLFGNKIVNSERLVLPHPRMEQRRFVLEPLSELVPGMAHPVSGKAVSEILGAVMGQKAALAEPFLPTAEYLHIAVEGPIGVGKTSLAIKLAEYYGSKTALELAKENPFLRGFYKEKERYALSAQLFFLLSRQKQIHSCAVNGPFISDFMQEKDVLFSSINLSGEESKLYNEVRRSLIGKPEVPDLAIFLSADTNTLLDRIGKRGRKDEEGITDDYVDRVNASYRDWFSSYGDGPALLIDTNGSDLVNDETAFGKLLNRISRPITGREVY